MEVLTSGMLGNTANAKSVQTPEIVSNNLQDRPRPKPLLDNLSASQPPQRLPHPPCTENYHRSEPNGFQIQI